jgi:hypothetical protein
MADAGHTRPSLTTPGLPPFPRLWIGFALAALFLIAEIAEVRLIDLRFPGDHTVGPVPLAISLAGALYWLFCVHRLHKILAALAPDGYPISPAKAVGFHFIPLFNLYWLVHWPYILANFLREQGVPVVNGQFLGLFLLIAVILGRLIDGALGLAGLFGVTAYISAKIHRQLEVNHQTAN